jgi:hypothetical protein
MNHGCHAWKKPVMGDRGWALARTPKAALMIMPGDALRYQVT